MVEAAFTDELPEINTALEIEMPALAAEEGGDDASGDPAGQALVALSKQGMSTEEIAKYLDQDEKEVARQLYEAEQAGDGASRVVRRRSSARTLVCEVQQHLGDDRVRAVAMGSTDGLQRGAKAFDTGAPITVPVGRGHARPAVQPARRDDRRGRAGRDRGALADPPRRAVGRGPDADARDLRDRDQGGRPPRALRARRQGGPVRRRRGRQDRADPGADPQPRRRSTAACRRSAASASARARATTSGSR